MGFRVSPATLSDHKAAERALQEAQPKREQKVFYVVSVPVPSAANGLADAPFPYYLPTFETREAAQGFRAQSGLIGYAITELVLQRG